MAIFCPSRSLTVLVFVTAWSANDFVGASCGQHQTRLSGGARHLQQGGSDSPDCEILEGLNFPAALLLNDGNETIARSSRECCEMCIATEGCKIWTYYKAAVPGASAQSCWMKAADSTKSDCEQCISGIAPKRVQIKERSAAPPHTCVTMEGLDFNQGDLFPHGRVTADHEECCRLCMIEPECKAWTRTYNGECFLKRSVHAPNICQHCEISGLVDGRATRAELRAVTNFLELVAGSASEEAHVFLKKVQQLSTSD